MNEVKLAQVTSVCVHFTSQHLPDETEKRQKISIKITGIRTIHHPKIALCKNIAVQSEVSAVSVCRIVLFSESVLAVVYQCTLPFTMKIKTVSHLLTNTGLTADVIEKTGQ
jgi:hypothetical protein